MTGGIYRPDTDGALLAMVNVCKTFPVRKSFFAREDLRVRAVDGVSLTVPPGKTLGLVGESGCGKTTLARLAIRLLDPDSGSIRFDGNDITRMEGEALRTTRRQMQIVFQDPYSSLNPRMNVLDIVGEPLLVNGVTNRREREDRVRELLVRVGLKPDHMRRYPHAFSGGERQRIGIARALALQPRLIVADEPVSALDVSVQAQVLNLLQELQEQFGLTYLVIAHDLSVVRHISDRVAVMYVGQLAETADVDALFASPLHPYTEALLSAVPRPDPRRRPDRILLSGEVADPSRPPAGCTFHPRCRYCQPRCSRDAPELREITPGHFARCHFAEVLELRGAYD
jgi:oligopeptide/dipeptide ABC transporter ATP-binding protein